MSLLANQPPNAASQQVEQLRRGPSQIVTQLVQGWERSFDLTWSNQHGVTPAERFELLGKDAAELFDSSAAFVGFLVPLLTGKDDATVARITSKVAKMPAITKHADGTVTID